MILKKLNFANCFWLIISVIVIILDQSSKWLAMQELIAYIPRPIFSGFNLTLAYNKGIAFSFLDKGDYSLYLLFISFGVSCYLFIWLLSLPRFNHILTKLGLTFVLGGAIGNAIDRILWGHVIDFIQVYFQEYYWPIFNIADSAITIGAIALIIPSFKSLIATRNK